jgi:hypothetical protein
VVYVWYSLTFRVFGSNIPFKSKFNIIFEVHETHSYHHKKIAHLSCPFGFSCYHSFYFMFQIMTIISHPRPTTRLVDEENVILQEQLSGTLPPPSYVQEPVHFPACIGIPILIRSMKISILQRVQRVPSLTEALSISSIQLIRSDPSTCHILNNAPSSDSDNFLVLFVCSSISSSTSSRSESLLATRIPLIQPSLAESLPLNTVIVEFSSRHSVI